MGTTLSGVVEDPTGAPGGFYWYLVTGINALGEGSSGPEAPRAALGTAAEGTPAFAGLPSPASTYRPPSSDPSMSSIAFDSGICPCGVS